MVKKRKIINKQQLCASLPQVTDNYEPWYVNRDMSLGQFNVQTSAMEQMAQDFNNWHLCNNYYQSTIDMDIYSRLEGDVTTLMPLAIPKQPEDNWFNALADTPAVASPLEMLAWLHVPNSTSLGKRTFHLETGPNIPKYGLTEYKALTGLGEPEDGPMELSRSNEQDNPEDREAKKAWIQTVIGTEIHRHMTVQVPDSPPTVYKAWDEHDDSPVEYWQPEDVYHEDYWSYGPGSIPDDAPDPLFMGNDSYSEGDTSEVYYTYGNELTNHFSYLPCYTYDCDS